MLAGVVRHESGAAQVVAVTGEIGALSLKRAAISSDGYLGTLENAGVGTPSGPGLVATDGVNATDPSRRASRSTKCAYTDTLLSGYQAGPAKD